MHFPDSIIRLTTLVFLTLTIGVASCIAEDCPYAEVVVATTPAPPQTASRIVQLQGMWEAAPADPDIVLVGDSIAAGWPAGLLEEQLPGHTVFNFGLGSDQTQNVLWRLEAPGLASIQPRLVILVVGTNNLRSAETCGTIIGIREVADKLHTLWPSARVAIVGILYRGFLFEQYRQEIDIINAAVERSTRGKHNEIFVGEHAIYCGLPEAVGPVTRAAMAGLADLIPVCSNFADDWLHLRSGGYRELSRHIKNAFAD